MENMQIISELKSIKSSLDHAWKKSYDERISKGIVSSEVDSLYWVIEKELVSSQVAINNLIDKLCDHPHTMETEEHGRFCTTCYCNI
jgi:hypothetical protein